ncbi:hypothetical protein [Mesorhizobium sp. CN2-181]|uniref:hypothetical protein n=1 Tax=Mesorhizobium yinganensis TaxID=3157707 RepID=UPI0032B83092
MPIALEGSPGLAVRSGFEDARMKGRERNSNGGADAWQWIGRNMLKFNDKKKLRFNGPLNRRI